MARQAAGIGCVTGEPYPGAVSTDPDGTPHAAGVYLHAFAFAALAVVLLARHPAVTGVVAVWVLPYAFLSMRRVYRQPFLRTGVKYVALGTGYAMVLAVGLTITGVITLLLL